MTGVDKGGGLISGWREDRESEGKGGKGKRGLERRESSDCRTRKGWRGKKYEQWGLVVVAAGAASSLVGRFDEVGTDFLSDMLDGDLGSVVGESRRVCIVLRSGGADDDGMYGRAKGFLLRFGEDRGELSVNRIVKNLERWGCVCRG